MLWCRWFLTFYGKTSALKMEEIYSSKMLLTSYNTARYYYIEDCVIKILCFREIDYVNETFLFLKIFLSDKLFVMYET
jgi:hypothetical protein